MRVFDELFDDGGRPLDHLAGSNLIGKIAGSHVILPTAGSDPTLAAEYGEHEDDSRNRAAEQPPELSRGTAGKMREFDVHSGIVPSAASAA